MEQTNEQAIKRRVPADTARARARVAALSRSRTEDDPDMIRARRELKFATLRDRLAKALAEGPDLDVDEENLLVDMIWQLPRVRMISREGGEDRNG